MSGSWVLRDDLHDESFGEFATREQAMAAANRLVALPWDDPQIRAPCTNWRSCGRDFWLESHDPSAGPGSRPHGEFVASIRADGIRWAR